MVSRLPDKFRFFKSASGISGGGFLFFALFFLRGIVIFTVFYIVKCRWQCYIFFRDNTCDMEINR
jgi:hypothetical protein